MVAIEEVEGAVSVGFYSRFKVLPPTFTKEVTEGANVVVVLKPNGYQHSPTRRLALVLRWCGSVQLHYLSPVGALRDQLPIGLRNEELMRFCLRSFVAPALPVRLAGAYE